LNILRHIVVYNILSLSNEHNCKVSRKYEENIKFNIYDMGYYCKVSARLIAIAGAIYPVRSLIFEFVFDRKSPIMSISSLGSNFYPPVSEVRDSEILIFVI